MRRKHKLNSEITNEQAMEAWLHCVGANPCPATTHLHGCYSDRGNCTHPSEHRGEVTVDEG